MNHKKINADTTIEQEHGDYLICQRVWKPGRRVFEHEIMILSFADLESIVKYYHDNERQTLTPPTH